MSLLQAINELPLNTDGTATMYASYLKKFSLFVRETEVDDGSIYAAKELFTDENICGFLLKYFNEKHHKPHFKKAILAAIGSGLLYHGLPGLFSTFGVYPLTMKMKKVFNFIICFFNDID
jgi:hypothetical protein